MRTTKTIEVTTEQLTELTVKVCDLGESLGYKPAEFAILLAMVSKFMSDEMGIEVHSQKALHS